MANTMDPTPQADAESVKVTVSLPKELAARLDAHAATERRTRSNALRLILEDALNGARRAG